MSGQRMAAKGLLDHALAPLTFNWGFLDASVEAVSDRYARWQRMILHRVKIAAIDLPLDEVGGYTMQIALDDQVHASVRLQVRMGAPVLPASGMVS